MSDGYIKLSRKIFETEGYYDEKFSKIQAWIDLILLARWQISPEYKNIRGIRVKVERGQIARPVSWFCERWRWGTHTVISFFSRLEKRKQIAMQKSNVITLISICNYDLYQCNGDETSNASSNASQKEEENPPNNIINNPLKEEEKIKEERERIEKLEKDFQKRKNDFKNTIAPYVQQYGRDMCNDFFCYWTEPFVDRPYTMKFEDNKTWSIGGRLATWYRREKKK